MYNRLIFSGLNQGLKSLFNYPVKDNRRFTSGVYFNLKKRIAAVTNDKSLVTKIIPEDALLTEEGNNNFLPETFILPIAEIKEFFKTAKKICKKSQAVESIWIEPITEEKTIQITTIKKDTQAVSQEQENLRINNKKFVICMTNSRKELVYKEGNFPPIEKVFPENNGERFFINIMFSELKNIVQACEKTENQSLTIGIDQKDKSSVLMVMSSEYNDSVSSVALLMPTTDDKQQSASDLYNRVIKQLKSE